MRFVFLLFLGAWTASAANLIPNSSFECGTENWIAYGSYDGPEYGNDTSVSGRLSPTNTVHGNFSLLWRTRLFTQPMYLLAGNYKATHSHVANSTTTLMIGLVSHDYVTTNDLTSSFSVPTSVVRVTNTFVVISNGFYSLKLYRPSTPENLVWTDAIQFETGTVASAYAPMSAVEIGLGTTNLSHILNAATPNVIQLKAWNNGSAVGMTSIVEVFNHENTNLMAATAITTNALAAGGTTINVTLPAKVGWMRAMAHIPQVNNPFSELIFFVRPYPASTAQDTNGVFGAHPNAGVYGMRRDREAGYTWSRSLSPSAVARWSTVQPNGTGAFDWTGTFMDVFMAIFATNGTVPFITLTPGLDFTWPRDATNGNPPQADINAWSNYCRQVVVRYSPAPTNAWVYEIGNEWHNITTPTDFLGDATSISLADSNRARFIVAGAQAVRAACPNCTVVGISGDSLSDRAWRTWTNMTVNERTNINVISAHLYPIGQGSDNPNADEDDIGVSRSALLWAQTFAGTGKPLWDSEMGGAGNKGGMLGPISLSSPIYQTYGTLTPEAGRDWGMAQRKIVAVERESRQVLRCLGVGFAKVFAYTSAQITDDIWSSQSFGASSMEFSGAPRQGAAAALIAANYFARGPGLGRVTNNTTLSIEAYLFTNVLGSVIAFWSSDQAPRSLALTNPVALYEVMGNLVQTNNTNVLMGRTPQYLVSGTLSLPQFMANFTNALVASYTDVTGPNVSIDATPIGTVGSGTYFFKWTLTDKNKQAWSIGSYSPDNTNNRSRVKFFAADTWRDCGESNHFFSPFTVNRQFNLIVEGKDFYNNTTEVTGPAFGLLEAAAVGATNTLNVSGTANIGTITIAP